MEREELLELFEEFLNERELWNTFADWLRDRGYEAADLGFEDEE